MRVDIVGQPGYTPEEVTPGEEVTFQIAVRSKAGQGDETVHVAYALSKSNNIWFEVDGERQKAVLFAGEKVTEDGVDLEHKAKVMRGTTRNDVFQARVFVAVIDANNDKDLESFLMKVK